MPGKRPDCRWYRGRNGWIILDVQDDGVGFDPAQLFAGHLGWQSMRERPGELGGSLEIDSTRDRGTRASAGSVEPHAMA